MKRSDQVSVPLPPELKAFVSQAAARDDRTVAGQIRHILADWAARQGAGQEARAA
jgi:hypothetical protein